MDELGEEEVPLVDDASMHFMSFIEKNNDYSKNVQNQSKLETVYEDDDVVENSIEYDEDENTYTNLLVDFFSHVEKGDCDKMERAIDGGLSPNARCPKSLMTACHFAAFFGHFKMVQVLIGRGAWAFAPDAKGRTPLEMCVWNGHDMCLEVLFEHLQKDSAHQDEEEIVDGEEPEIPALELMDKVWCDTTPVHLASARIQPNSLQILINNGYDPKKRDVNGYSPLDVCGEGYEMEELMGTEYEKYRFDMTVKILAERYETTGGAGIMRSSPLHKSIDLDTKDATKLLLGFDAYKTSWDENGETPVHVAIAKKKKQLLQIMVFQATEKMIADVKNRDGLAPLHFAIANKWRKAVTILLKAGANVLAVDKKGNTVLHYAAMCGIPALLAEIISALPDKQTNMEMINRDKETALFSAISAGDEKSVRVLLDEKASIRATSRTGYTPLHAAVKAKQKKILKLILAADANAPPEKRILDELCSTDDYGMSPLHMASNDNNLECFKTLVKFGADLKKKSTVSSFTALHIAAMKGHLKIVELILDTDISTMEQYDFQSWKPFHRAIHKGHRDCVTVFIRKGADLSEDIVHRGKIKTSMQLLMGNMPRATNYLEKLFDDSISKNDCEIDDECCEIRIDYSVLMPAFEVDPDNQMGVVVALLDTGKRSNQRKLLLHPYIESFLYLKWMNGLRFFYGFLASLYMMFVLSFTVTVVRIYSNGGVKDASCKVLGGFTIWIFIQEILLFIIMLSRNKLWNYFKRSTAFVNWLTAGLAVAVMMIDHTKEGRNWPKGLTGVAIFMAWLQVTILLSHFPECGYTFQMFYTVTMRALKVMAIFGIEVLIGFALAFWVMFSGSPTFGNFADSLIRTIVMTTEFDYVSLFENLDASNYRLFVQCTFVLFIFFVPIVMMNLILALIISDTNDLKTEGKIKRLTGQVRLVDILDTVIYFMAKKRLARLERVIKIYPGKPSWEAISLVSNNIEEALYKRVRPAKNDDSNK